MKRFKIAVRDFIAHKPAWVLSVFASLAAFLTYSSMYAFRKPFAVGEFQNLAFLGIDFKIWLITAQVTGYTLSKFVGINFIAELKNAGRAVSILVLIGLAELSLFLFYLVPQPYSLIFMFFNGLPLGIIWGIVFSYLEGRRVTEILGAALSASFIIASGVVKSVGKMVIVDFHVSEFAMPFVTGLIFVIPLVISLYFLDCVPPPSPMDEQLRTKREPMDKGKRKAFIKNFLPGIVLLISVYIFLTIFRELRDNFAVELWNSLGFKNNSAIFTQSEIPVTLFTLLSLAMVAFIRNNYRAFRVILYFIAFGFLLIFLSATLFYFKIIDGLVWMIVTGIGLYLGYVPFNAFLYERLIASFKVAGNIGFIMYISDAFGYLGSLGIVFYKNFASPGLNWVDFFTDSGMLLSVPGIVIIMSALHYFAKKQYKLNNIPDGIGYSSRKPLFAFNSGAPVNK